MSEPMSSIEIEDVLSSIRRLVSDDRGPFARDPGPEPAAATSRPAEPPRLLLTPALRVVRRPAPEDEIWEEEADAIAQPLAPLDWTLPETRAPSSPDPASAAPLILTRPQPGASAHRFTLTAVPSSTFEEESLDIPLPVPPLDLPPEPSAALPEGAPEEASPDPAGDPGLHTPGAAAAWAQPVDQFDPTDRIAPEQMAPEQGDAVPSPDEAWADRAAAEAIADIEAAGPTGADPSLPPHDFEADFDPAEAADDITYDEELLRDLVRDIIREELAGHLGEKITRNVRKLVRAEIAQALAVRELS